LNRGDLDAVVGDSLVPRRSDLGHLWLRQHRWLQNANVDKPYRPHEDQLDPVANDHILARLIPRARLVLYPDAGHGFLFQDGTPFASRVDSFLTGHPSS
jgi:pimeloyl-ACP methyl ester carboxylesterase